MRVAVECKKIDIEITFATPGSGGQDVKFLKVKESPWIDNCRRSAKKKCATTELPDLIPAPHLLHPISANHEATATVFTHKDNACINLDAFLIHSALEDMISQKKLMYGLWGSKVLGEDSPL
ncbi:hypothetical protein Pmani_016447 [Petrolisthes manimaculis]|uniref:Uncharacterized protein n=1 Tax=Petrolisthes manimaculis TaxID=1843537 RepID=A0AAE1U6D3_9EUCA|nr:hypothetical protein Pmani_016447 [Petrolisthes manimaculis]